MTDKLIEVVARGLCIARGVNPDVVIDDHPRWMYEQKDAVAFQSAIEVAGMAVVPKEPTREMLLAARDWSVAKYGMGVGNDGASGCYRAMLAATPQE